jgi:hypothetical protein
MYGLHASGLLISFLLHFIATMTSCLGSGERERPALPEWLSRASTPGDESDDDNIAPARLLFDLPACVPPQPRPAPEADYKPSEEWHAELGVMLGRVDAAAQVRCPRAVGIR